ncbi:hypothetical protein FHG87_022828 [Trinorchestia longiramus]|nr:hypothetical protein FHG87_022828 [Trinorchestia longiramus]
MRLSESMFLWKMIQAFCSNMDHTPKFIGFKSGEDGGQSSFDKNPSKLSLQKLGTNLEVWMECYSAVSESFLQHRQVHMMVDFDTLINEDKGRFLST